MGCCNRQGHCRKYPPCVNREMAERGGDKPGSQNELSLDMDAMIDEILAKKGPQKYEDGLSEENWEQVMTYVI